MTDNASSKRPGFSYLVGPTDSINSLLRNLSDAASCGGDAILGRLRSDEYEGGTAWLSDGRDAWCDGGRDDEDGWPRGAGEPDLDRGRRLERLFSRLVRNSCSNRCVKSVALNS